MNLLVPILLVSFMSQGSAQKPPKRLPSKHGRITLPPVVKKPKRPQETRTVDNDPDSFYRDVIDLRRSKILTQTAEEQLLVRLHQHYDDPARMAVELAMRSKNDLLYGLMKVVDRYGDKHDAERLHFQVLTRAMGQATSRVVKTITQKAGSDRAKAYLYDYLTSKFAPARSTAAALLPNYLTQDDVPRLLLLSRERKADIRRKVVGILANIDDPRVRKRIIQMLTQDSSLAADACVAAIAQGREVLGDLDAIVSRPARGRSFGYAAFALTRIEKALGEPKITKAMIPNLSRALASDDPLLSATSAIALATYAYRCPEWEDRPAEDKKIVDGLLGLVAPDKFISSLKLLQPAAVEILVKFSGRNFHTRGSAWRGWWQDVRPKFVGLRRAVSVTAKNAEHAQILWSVGEYFLSFRGAQVPLEDVPQGATPYILSPDQFLGLLAEVKTLGFMTENALPQTKEVWTIDLRVGGARALLELEPSRGKAFHQCFAAVARAEMWQKYRDPKGQPDAAAFWRVERRWLAEHAGQETKRLVWHVMRRLPGLEGKGRQSALDDLQSVPGLPHLITEANANELIAVAKRLEKFNKSDFRLLEIALLAPGDTTWRKVIGVLDGRITGAGDGFATHLFQLLGPQRVVIAIRHKSPSIAVAAMHDAAANRNPAAIPVLIARMKDKNVDVQRTAIYALGVLHATNARAELIAYEKAAHPVIRREIWGALGRIGGAGVPAILKRAMETANLDDKLSALSAMGHTQSAEIGQYLAARCISVDDNPDVLAQRAEYSLRQLGPILAIPALHAHLQMQAGPGRERLILLLGEFQDPLVVRDLIDLLRAKRSRSAAARYLAEITGVDLRQVDARARRMYAWFAANRSKSQAQWFLDALAGARIPTTLQVQNLTRREGVAAVGELSRLMITVDSQHLRVLCATMLRETTGKDFTRGVRNAEEAELFSIAERYKSYAASIRAAAK